MLVSAPIIVGGSWTGDDPRRVQSILALAHAASLSGLKLECRFQPKAVIIQHDFTASCPAVMRADSKDFAVMRITSGNAFWAQLVYQFGHELGHVLANNWGPEAQATPPSHWIEEVVVEAFSLRSLGLVADAWKNSPPKDCTALWFINLLTYRRDVLQAHAGLAPGSDTLENFSAYYAGRREDFALHRHLDDTAKPIAAWLSRKFDGDSELISDLSAMNSWTERSQLSDMTFLSRWSDSCSKFNLPGRLPTLIAEAVVAAPKKQTSQREVA